MNVVEHQLPDNVEELKSIIQELKNSSHSQKQEIAELAKLLKRKDKKIKALTDQLYGKKSEKQFKLDPTQSYLFNEIETYYDLIKNKDKDIKENEEKETITVPEHTRVKKTKAKQLPDYLERIEVIHELPEKDRQCPCGCTMEPFSQQVREILHLPKQRPYVQKDIITKYKCKKCNGENNDGRKPEVMQSNFPSIILPQTIATPDLLAYSIYSKYELHLPIYRIANIFSSLDIPITRNNLCNWLIKLHVKIKDMFNFIQEYIKSSPMIGIDESPFQVHKEPGKSDRSKSYIWILRGGPPGKEITLYLYRDNRSAEFLMNLLEGYKGYILTDSYASYDSHLGEEFNGRMAKCWIHARRKFVNLAKDKNGDAIKIIDYIARLYEIEARIRDKNLYEDQKFDEIVAIRQEFSKPIVDEVSLFMDSVYQKSYCEDGIKEGIKYFNNHKEHYYLFLYHGEILIDNNPVENKARPFALGRKNWLFSGSPSGAEASAFYFTLIDAFKTAGIDRHDGLTELFTFLIEDRSEQEVQAKFWDILGW